MGKGLRSLYKVGDQLKLEDVEKIYMLKDEKHTKDYIRLLEDAPKEYVEVIQSAIQMAEEKMEGKLGEQIFVSLLDHLIFAIKEAGARNCSSKSDALGNSEILSRRISGGGGNAAGN